MENINDNLLNCRLCASLSVDTSTVSIFKKSIQSSELGDIIYNCFGIQILENDKLPKIICKKCHRFINKIKDFKRKCQESNIILSKLLISMVNAEQKKVEVVDLQAIKIESDENISGNVDMLFDIVDVLKTDNIDMTDDCKPKLDSINCTYISPTYDTVEDSTVKLETKLEDSMKKNVLKRRGKTKKNIIKQSSEANVRKKHENDPTKVCEICGKSTKRISEHMIVHLKTRFNCPRCTNSYPHRATLRRHILTHSDKKYSCEHCQMRFSCHGYLKRHLMVHSGERNFICDICEKAFQTKYNLNTHIRIHTKERPFKCKNCKLAFAHRATFNIHTRECNNLCGTT